MMSNSSASLSNSLHHRNSVDTINAAATAIVMAESRVQPSSVQQKKRWGSWFSLYWCFGSTKHSKRIGHAVLVPEPVVPGAPIPPAENSNITSSIVLPFIAPPSSPASFLQSEPPSSTQSPGGILSLTSLSMSAYSPRGPASIFAIGPYAHETQLVSPPVFSAFTTEPSTAPFTPPPEQVQMTTPSSPEVPFAQLLSSSLDRNRRNSGTNSKLPPSHYEFANQFYPGSPGGNLISPGSVISNSGTSSPLPGKHSILELRAGEAPKLLGFEYFTGRKWGSRLGSGSVTPEGVGLGSRLGSGSLTPDGLGPASRDSFLPTPTNQISEVASLANSAEGSPKNNAMMDPRVSFELTGVMKCLESDRVASLRFVSGASQRDETENNTEACYKEASFRMHESGSGQGETDHIYKKHRSNTLGSTKEFNFDSATGEVSDKPIIGSDWWANEKVVGSDLGPGDNWTFFPTLKSGVS